MPDAGPVPGAPLVGVTAPSSLVSGWLRRPAVGLGEREGTGTEDADAPVVVEPGHPADPGQRRGAHRFAHRAARARAGGQIQQTEPGMLLPGAVRHDLPEDLQSGADRQAHRPLGQGRAQPVVPGQPLRGEVLGGVLAATDHVQLAPDRRRRCRR